MAEETALATIQDYAIIASSADDMAALLEANGGGSGFQPSDLQKITIPAGGGTQWEIPSLDGSDYAPEIDCVMVNFQDGRVFWEGAMDGGGSPPDCTSGDMVTGVGTPGGACVTCPNAQFGSAENGNGQACKVRRDLFVVRKGDMLPMIVQLPATSFAACKQFFMRLLQAGVPYYSIEVGIRLVNKTSKSGIKYSVAEFSKKGSMTDEQVTRFRSISTKIAEVFGG